MLLSEFLSYFDFDYKVVNGQIRLVDLQDVYLGDIGEDRFDLSKPGLAGIVDRLEIYIKDYVTDDLEEHLIESGVDGVDKMDLGEMAKIAREKDVSCDFDVIDAILNPASLKIGKEKIMESFSVGQIFYEKDTERFIVLDELVNDSVNKDIWKFKVYNKNMEHLYDTTAFDARLAQDIINGYIVSVTHEKVLRIEPDCLLEWKGELSATLEDNDKLWERFADCYKPEDGELKYVTVDYNPAANSMAFKLHCEKVDKNNFNVLRNVIDITAEPEEKETLLKEMKAFKPAFFEKLEKPTLNETISAAEHQKKGCSSGVELKRDDSFEK